MPSKGEGNGDNRKKDAVHEMKQQNQRQKEETRSDGVIVEENEENILALLSLLSEEERSEVQEGCVKEQKQ